MEEDIEIPAMALVLKTALILPLSWPIRFCSLMFRRKMSIRAIIPRVLEELAKSLKTPKEQGE